MSDLDYKITMSEHLTEDYREGFADGFSRAWQECWDHWIEKIDKSQKEHEDLLRRQQEDEKK